MDALEKKQNGVVYTPEKLASLMAEQLFDVISSEQSPLTIVDPACGNGALLGAVAKLANQKNINVHLLGFDTDNLALLQAEELLDGMSVPFSLHNEDFLEFVLYDNKSGFSVDGIIANPPYVRTQQLGGDVTKKMAKNFHLSGKIDIYQAFYAAMPFILKDGGAISVITSNKFITNKTGADLRKLLVQSFHISKLIDLGDTKLFDAAVLPAIVVANKESKTQTAFDFYKIYESTKEDVECKFESVDDVYSLINNEKDGYFKADSVGYKATKGKVNVPGNLKEPWVLSTSQEYKWAENVRATFGSIVNDLADVRVGIKTTADKVFIRNSWDDVDPMPERTLIHPLYSAKKAKKWKISTDEIDGLNYILYPMEPGEGRKKASPVKLDNYPKAREYLEMHHEELARRTYVIKAGREWYEIWVPQDPKKWPQKKIIFPDISELPKFMLDTDGLYVDGNCYWITLKPGVPEDYLYLILGVANSAILQRYHTVSFQNKLYSNKYRYITQYVEKYPVPNLSMPEAQNIVALVKRLLNYDLSEVEQFEHEIDAELNKILNSEQAFGGIGQQKLF